MDETSTKATNLCVYFINRGQQVKGKLVRGTIDVCRLL